MKFVESKVMIVENLINCRNLYNFVQKQTKKGVSPLYWGLPDISECQATLFFRIVFRLVFRLVFQIVFAMRNYK